MAELKARWLSLIDEYSAGNDAVIVEPVQPVAPYETPLDSVSEIAEDLSADDSTEELPIHEAPAAQINYWHARGNNVFLQTLLREYDLDYSSANVAAYSHFKIGMDETRHVATFALDDTHYYQIQFDKYNAQPLNKAEARLVLKKISAIRFATRRFKDFCGVRIEYFD